MPIGKKERENERIGDSGEKCIRDASRIDEEGDHGAVGERSFRITIIFLRFIYRQGHDTAVSSLFSMISI